MTAQPENVELFHQQLEQRSNLSEVALSLNGHQHKVLLPSSGELESEDELYLLQRASTLRWMMGPGVMSVEGHSEAQKVLNEAYSENGLLGFESKLFADLTVPEPPGDIPAGDGVCHLFIDIGGSSIKGAFFSNRQLSRQLSKAWEPFRYTEMEELLTQLEVFLTELRGDRAAESMSHVAISCAGLCQGGALLASTLTQGMSFDDGDDYDPWFLKKLMQRQFPEASFRLLNDGEVTALPHREQAPFGERCVISLVMGSNLGGGYYSMPRMDAVHEIGFMPFLLGSELRDTWSGYEGIASEVFSKKGLLWIAGENGYVVSEGVSERDVIDRLHTDLKHGLVKARIVFQKLGQLLAPFVAYLQRYYPIDEVLLSGGILTSDVVDEMRAPYHSIFSDLGCGEAPPLRMLVVPGVLPEYNQVWSLALNHFAENS